ncbi:hypothetical protein BU25DRAFT_75473 [Macroventuria anomochaeta]|uniref:Uncharacterized protein n=1 Tax=Macroventuria anomochaeta TaxID=301207 RepID=A0ACB6RYY4_9PLEO|nr:uncharacterized protein BU25DRAFT_75473 [Macroventuria anomochaeta]KAF2626938.1 hypothetical protein BU25DRAFT_75473 [Macroventuria anomochaeta]
MPPVKLSAIATGMGPARKAPPPSTPSIYLERTLLVSVDSGLADLEATADANCDGQGCCGWSRLGKGRQTHNNVLVPCTISGVNVVGKMATVASPLAVLYPFGSSLQFSLPLVDRQVGNCHDCQLPDHIYIQLTQITGDQLDPIAYYSPPPILTCTLAVHQQPQHLRRWSLASSQDITVEHYT